MLTPLPREGVYMVDHECEIEIDHRDGTRTAARIPYGFKTDGASIPRFFWRVVGTPFEPDLMLGALLHDRLYRTGAVTRRQADEALYDRMRLDGVGRVRARVIWLAVRLFGWLFWHRCGDDRDACREG